MKILLILAFIVTLLHAQIDYPPAFDIPATTIPTTTTPVTPTTTTTAYRIVTPVTSNYADLTSTTGVDASGTPSASIAAETASTESAPIQTKAYYFSGSYSSAFDAANNYWNAAVTLGQTCCGNCSRICGVAFKITNSNRYLTNVNNNYLAFQPSSNPGSNQVFTLNQNSDCTWSIQNVNRYLSTSNSNGGNWVSFSATIGAPERWYLQRHGNHVHVQSAYLYHKYWIVDSSSSSILRYSEGASTLTMQIYPCDKTWGWN